MFCLRGAVFCLFNFLNAGGYLSYLFDSLALRPFHVLAFMRPKCKVGNKFIVTIHF